MSWAGSIAEWPYTVGAVTDCSRAITSACGPIWLLECKRVSNDFRFGGDFLLHHSRLASLPFRLNMAERVTRNEIRDAKSLPLRPNGVHITIVLVGQGWHP